MTSDQISRWAPIATFALAIAGVIFTTVFWAVTDRVEPSFVVLFGSLLTASGLLASKQPPKLPPSDETPEP